jgi:hypothetical protein
MRDLTTLGKPPVYQSTIGALGAQATWKLEKEKISEDAKYSLKFLVQDLVKLANEREEGDVRDLRERRLMLLLQHIGDEVAVLGSYSSERVVGTLVAYQLRDPDKEVPFPYIMLALQIEEAKGSMGASDVEVPVHLGRWNAGEKSVISVEEFQAPSEYTQMFS